MGLTVKKQMGGLWHCFSHISVNMFKLYCCNGPSKTPPPQPRNATVAFQHSRPLQAFLEVWESVLQMAVPVDEHNGSSSPEANQRVNGLSARTMVDQWIPMDINR